jgi:hypothetical protein
LQWAKGSTEYLSAEYGTALINSADADHAWDIRDRHSISSSLHLLNRAAIAWKCKKQATMTLQYTGSDIVSLAEGVKKTGHIRDFLSSIGYPVGEPTPTLENNQGTITFIKASLLQENNYHLATHISWLNEQYTMGIIKLLYTKTILQLLDCNTKPLWGRHLQSILAYVMGVPFYPAPNSKHYQSLYLNVFRLLSDYITYSEPIPLSSPDPM